jgi:UDP-N-acetylmuramyl pentapeptide phosphotransferase/UDP-N-acetylglucosamine-1-phosphate transferase
VNHIIIIIFNILLIFLLNILFLKKKFLLDKKQLVHKSFISNDIVPLSGGFLIFFNLLFFNKNYLENIFFLGIFLLGILSDLLIIKKPITKFIIQLFIVVSFLLLFNINILETKIYFIDYFIKNKLFALFFTTFCLLVLINGSNFLDGINTLVCGYYFIIILAILYVGNYNKINFSFYDFHYVLASLLVVFLFNFFSKTYLGDSGTFLLSFLVGYKLISLSNENLALTNYISPIFILLLLWYPAFENLFSIIRKILSKKKVSEPDNLHLHHLLFSFFNAKINNKKIINSLSGLVINLYNFIVFLIGAQFYNQSIFLLILVTINIFIYVIFYFFLSKQNSLLKK